MIVIASGDKRMQVASGVCKRREEVIIRKEKGTMRVIASGAKRRQVASGVYTRREEVIREDTEQ